MSEPRTIVLSSDHAASSYGVPVLLLDGDPTPYGPADWTPYGPASDLVLLWSRQPERTLRERADAEMFLSRPGLWAWLRAWEVKVEEGGR